ncbi:SUKH-4 family immunity protein [Streptomyces galbus]|uniref:SUKH-4 family immunity protein n=1 Tax=Streptomyces galbus TaxID=33898 RepID=UPI00289873AF|nr:SUKH-4 family immunity protein [Streptomyces galbus]
MESLRGLLASGTRAPAFRADSLLRTEEVAPFAPGALAHPLPMPHPDAYPPRAAWTAHQRAQAQAEARARFEQDWYAAQAAEARRRQQLAAYQQEYERQTEAHRAEVRRHNAGVTEVTDGVRRGEPGAVVEFFSAALYAATAWPEGFPRQVGAAYDPAARHLVVDWELPRFGVVPEAKAVRWSAADGDFRESARPVTQRRALYREVLAQSVLLVLHQLFAADPFGALSCVTLNGFVDEPDPATGRRGQVFLASVMAERSVFDGLRLAVVDPVSCVTDGLRGQLSARPDQLTAVRPALRPEDLGDRVVTHDDGAEEPDLSAMDPIAFEGLVAELFRAMGMQAVTTRRSNDGGVEVDALDPAPIRGGTIVVQVKRYRNTVPPSAVRDLYGTVQDRGANKGVLLTTSGFGPSSYTFVRGKPLELITGPQLVDLLHRHGLRGRLGDGAAATPAAGAPGAPGMPPGAPGPMPPGAVPPPGVPVPGQPPAYGYPQQPPGQPTVGPGYQAVLRYRAQDGSEQQLIRRSAPGTPHPEWQIFHELRAMNVPPDQVLELHTELESCELPGAYCARMIREQWPQARITSIAPYGTDHASRQQGMQQLLAHQGELHQVADGPARPAPVRAPLPPVHPAPPLPPEAVAQELGAAFGPGIFRVEQAAVSRQGVPPIVAHALVVAGLPVDVGPFFWAQAQPGRPVPTLAELAQERGVQPAPDAGSYLVMGSDFGKALCVQYGTANIVAVPVEAGPGGAPVPPQFVNTGLVEFQRCLALLGRMWRLRFGLNQEQAGRWTVDFQAQLAALDPAALGSPESWWSVLLEQMWDGLL